MLMQISEHVVFITEATQRIDLHKVATNNLNMLGHRNVTQRHEKIICKHIARMPKQDAELFHTETRFKNGQPQILLTDGARYSAWFDIADHPSLLNEEVLGSCLDSRNVVVTGSLNRWQKSLLGYK